MKFKHLTTLFLASAVALFGTNQAIADTQNTKTKQQTQQKPKQTQQKQGQNKQTQQKATQQKQNQQKKTQQKQAQKKPATMTQEQALKAFNDAFAIKFMGYSFSSNAENQVKLVLKYDLINKGKKDIRAVQFIGALTQEEKVLHAESISLNFDPLFKAKQNISVDLELPVEKIAPDSLAILANPQKPIGVLNGARALVFSDNTGILIENK